MKKKRDNYINIKVWQSSRRKLRIIAAQSDENMIEVVDRLVSKELQKIKKENRSQFNRKCI